MSKKSRKSRSWRKNFSHADYLEGQGVLERLQVRFPVLFPSDRQNLKPWALKEDVRLHQALAEAEDGEMVPDAVWRAALDRWFNSDPRRRVAYVKGLIAGTPRYDMYGNVSGVVSEVEAASAAAQLPSLEAWLAKFKAKVKPVEAVRCSETDQGNGRDMTGGMMEGETLADRIWRQVEHGIDESLLPTREKRTRDLAKKLDRELDKNGWRIFVSGCVYTMANGKGPQRRNAEVMLVDTVRRWRDQVVDLLPERAADLKRIVEAGLKRPEPPRKD